MGLHRSTCLGHSLHDRGLQQGELDGVSRSDSNRCLHLRLAIDHDIASLDGSLQLASTGLGHLGSQEGIQPQLALQKGHIAVLQSLSTNRL